MWMISFKSISIRELKRRTISGVTAIALLLIGVFPAVAGSIQAPASGTPIESFTFGGNAPWFMQSTVSHDGIGAYQSGPITNSQASWMETTVSGPGAVRFWWKVSSESCCDQLQFSIDGSSETNIRGEIGWQSKVYAIPAGNHTLRWTYSTDGSVFGGSNAGWVDEVTFDQGTFDFTPPVTTASPPGGIVGTTQTVTLSANEPATIYYSTNGTEPTTESSQYVSPITIISTTTLKFFAVDTAGNIEQSKTAAYIFDTTPPFTSASPAAGTYVASRAVSLSCSDSGMGCAATYYCLGSGCTPSTTYSSPITIATSTDLRCYSVDKAGNNEAIKTNTYTITPDITSPTTTPSYPGGVYDLRNVSLTCNDGNGSGCADTYYCLGAGCTPTTKYASYLTLKSSTDLRFYSQDKWGNNESIKTVSYIIDATAPVTNASPVGGIGSSPLTVTLACSDGSGSGCSSIRYCLGKGCTPSTAYNGAISITSSTDLRFYSRDIVNNDELYRTERYTILTAPPTTFNVPAVAATIQAAIDAAKDGDTVLVAPGTYIENINFKGKVITVASSGGAGVTVINGNQAGPVVTFNTDEERTTVLNGFTITNGNAGWTSPNYGNGGGVYIYDASPTIINNRINGNTASWGGGIYESFGSPLIKDNIITLNTGTSYGGGISVGGAAAAEVVGNIISDNHSGFGGGISMWAAGTPTIKGNTIRNNTASNDGGGISMDNWSDAAILQNLLVNNVANKGSAITWLTPSDDRGPLLVNNTIVDTDLSQGSVVFADGYDGGVLLANNIVSANGERTAVYCGDFNDINPPLFSHNIVYSPSGHAFGGICSNQNGMNGNIAAKPLFHSSAAGEYYLLAGSPGIDAGDGMAPSLPQTDFYGNARIIDGNNDGVAVVDIGMAEYVGDPQVVVSPSSWDFGSTPVTTAQTKFFTISNSGTAPLTVNSPLTITGTDSSSFIVVTGGANPCSSLTPTIPQGGSCTVGVTFLPSSGTKSANLHIVSNSLNSPLTDVPLSGTGVPVFYLTLNITGSGNISGYSSTNFSCAGPSCSMAFPAGAAMLLSAAPSTNFTFAGWSGGGCNGTGDCSLTLYADTTINATFEPIPLVQIVGKPTEFFSLNEAFAAAFDGCTLKARNVVFSGALNLDLPVGVTLRGGFNSDFETISDYTFLQGILTLGRGCLTVNNLVIR